MTSGGEMSVLFNSGPQNSANGVAMRWKMRPRSSEISLERGVPGTCPIDIHSANILSRFLMQVLLMEVNLLAILFLLC